MLSGALNYNKLVHLIMTYNAVLSAGLNSLMSSYTPLLELFAPSESLHIVNRVTSVSYVVCIPLVVSPYTTLGVVLMTSASS